VSDQGSASGLWPTRRPDSQQGSKKGDYLGLGSLLLLLFYTILNTRLSYEPGAPPIEATGAQLAVFTLFCLLWFSIHGLRWPGAVFGWVALQPAILTEGYGYVFLPGAALSPSDLMAVVAVVLWAREGQTSLRLVPYTRAAVALLAVCTISILLTLNPAFKGQWIRLALPVFLVIIVFSEQGRAAKCAMLAGIPAWPVVAFGYLAGVEQVVRFFSFGGGEALAAQASGEVLYGSHQFVVFLLPITALALAKGRAWLVRPLLLALAPYALFSLSRSLTAALGAAALLLLGMQIRRTRNVLDLAGVGLFLVGGVVAVSLQGYFEFGSGSKEGSSEVRFAKMGRAWETFLRHPLFGVGYGTVGVIDGKTDVDVTFMDDRFIENITAKKAAAENTAFQILAETGASGMLVSIWMLWQAGRALVSVLAVRQMPAPILASMYAWLVFFIASFLGGSVYSQLVFLLAIPVAACGVYLGPHALPSRALPRRRSAFQVSPLQQS